MLRQIYQPQDINTYNIFPYLLIGKFSESNNFSDEIQILNTKTYEWVNSISLETTITSTKTKLLARDGSETTLAFPSTVIAKAEAENEESKSFFTTIPKYVQAVIFCLGGLVVITIIFLTYYNIRRKKKAKTKHLSVVPYTNCNEEAKEDIIYSYMN